MSHFVCVPIIIWLFLSYHRIVVVISGDDIESSDAAVLASILNENAHLLTIQIQEVQPGKLATEFR